MTTVLTRVPSYRTSFRRRTHALMLLLLTVAAYLPLHHHYGPHRKHLRAVSHKLMGSVLGV